MDIFWLKPLTNDIDRNLNQQIDYFNGQWNTWVADIFRGIQNERTWVLWSFKNWLIDQFDAFEQSLNPSFNQFLQSSSDTARRVIPEIQQQSQFVRQQFWPDGEITWQANRFFWNLLNAVNNNISWQMSRSRNQASRQWASQSALNAALNEARNAWLSDLVSVQSQKLQEQQKLLNNFLQLQDSLRSQRISAEDSLIRQPLLSLNERINSLGTQLLTGLNSVDELWLQRQLAWLWAGWWGSSTAGSWDSGQNLDMFQRWAFVVTETLPKIVGAVPTDQWVFRDWSNNNRILLDDKWRQYIEGNWKFIDVTNVRL